MLNDDLFKSQEDLIVDECITFMLAASQTTTLMIFHATYHLTKNPEKRERLRKELRNHIDPSIKSL